MTLRLDLKPFECLRIGKARIQAGPLRISFSVSGTVPVMRERDIITREEAVCPASRLRFLLQQAYFEDESIDALHDDVLEESRNLFLSDTSTKNSLEKVINHVNEGDLFRALKTSISIHSNMQACAGSLFEAAR